MFIEKTNSDLDEKISYRVHKAMINAFNFVEKRGILTFDPLDLKATQIVKWSWQKQTSIRQAVRYFIYAGGLFTPKTIRKLLGVCPVPHAGGIAILANAYCALAKVKGDDILPKKAHSLLNWLVNHTSHTIVGEAWGQPYDWGKVPANTANAHTTMWCGNAFLLYFNLTNDTWALEHAVRACEWLIYGLNSTEHSSRSLSLSYTVLDKREVINTNADIASLLMRVGESANLKKYNEFGTRIIQFVIETQNEDGSWFYNAPDDVHSDLSNNGIDNGYHTGMTLSALIDIHQKIDSGNLHSKNCDSALKKGISFYMNKLVTRNGLPAFMVNQTYPIDIYSCGQAILTLTKASLSSGLDSEIRRDAINLVHRVVERTLSLMMNEDGSFIYRRYRANMTIRLYSLRWAQALMCLALAHYYDVFIAEKRKFTL